MEETLKISRRLEKILETDDENTELIIKYMERLEAIEMTLNILTKTGIGLIINKFRKKCKDFSVSAIAKQLIKQWKKLVPKSDMQQKPSKRQHAPSEDASPSRESENVSSDDEKSSSATKRSRLEPAADENSDSRSSKETVMTREAAKPPKQMLLRNHETSDQFRLKARQMIKSALDYKDIPPGSFDADFLAVQIETAIFNVFMNSGSQYKQRVRTRVMNLRDEFNDELRLNVLSGVVSAEKLAVMTSEDMASTAMKQERVAMMKEVIHESQLTLSGGTETDLIKCPKCRQSQCSYNQVQTRSADEPMTTFAYCGKCGHRWKFN